MGYFGGPTHPRGELSKGLVDWKLPSFVTSLLRPWGLTFEGGSYVRLTTFHILRYLPYGGGGELLSSAEDLEFVCWSPSSLPPRPLSALEPSPAEQPEVLSESPLGSLISVCSN